MSDRGGDPKPLAPDMKSWEMVEVDLKCRECQSEYRGNRPRFFVDKAKARGDEAPFWWATCDLCAAKHEPPKVKPTVRERPPRLETVGEHDDTNDDDTPF